MSRGNNYIKQMEFTESGVCKNARHDVIETKDTAEVLNEAFEIEEKRFIPALGKVAKRVIPEGGTASGKKLASAIMKPGHKALPKPQSLKKPMDPKTKKALIAAGLLGTGASGGYIISGAPQRKLLS